MIDEIGWVEVRAAAAAVVVRLTGEIDLSNVAQLEAATHAVPANGMPVVIDCTALAYLDSSGVRFLETMAARAIAVGVPVRVAVPPSSAVRRILVLTGLLLRCPEDPDVATALRKVQQ